MLCVWLFSFPIIFSMFSHVVARISTPLLLWADYTPRMGILPFVYPSSTDGHLGCCHLSTAVHSAAKNIHHMFFCTERCFQLPWVYILNRISGSYGNSMFNLFRN